MGILEPVHIRLGKKGDYSLRAVLDLARHHRKGRRKTREIAAATRVPPKYLSQILGNLVRQGLVTSVAGQTGGYALNRSPSRISLLDVIEAAEGPVRLKTCLLRGTPCGVRSTCAIHDAWAAAQEAMVRRLRNTTFAQIIRQESASAGR